MRIVHIEDIFYPEAGYQVNILAKYEVMEGHEVYIITCPMEFWDPQRKEFWGADNIEERDRKYEQESGARVVRFPTLKKYSSRILYKKGFSKYLEELKPDICFIHAESSFVTLQYLLKYNRLKFPIIMDSHSLEMAAANPHRYQFYKLYRKVFLPIIKKNNLYIIRTQDDDFLMRQLGIPAEQAPFISFGSDLTAFHPDAETRKRLREELEIPQDAFVIINTGKLTKDKGGLLFAEALKKKFPSDREVVLITVGTPTNDEYGLSVSALLDKSENRVIRIPTQKYYDLAKYYQASDLSVFARQCSLSFYDAQACGLPVILEDNSVNRERVSHNNGKVFPAGDAAALTKAIGDYLDLPAEEFRALSENAVRFIEKDYNYAVISAQYTALMQETIENFKRKKRK